MLIKRVSMDSHLLHNEDPNQGNLFLPYQSLKCGLIITYNTAATVCRHSVLHSLLKLFQLNKSVNHCTTSCVFKLPEK